jgi:DNA-binding CsgD family transcriptional regulator
MSAAIQQLFETLPQAASIDDFGGIVNRIRTIYGLEHVIYHAIHLGGDFAETARDDAGLLSEDAGVWRIEQGQLATLTYSAEWIRRYLDAGFVRIDPVISASLNAFHPIDWKTLDWSGRKKQDFLAEAIAAGVGNQGLTLPIRGPNSQFAVFTITKSCTDDDWSAFKTAFMPDLLIISHFYHQRIIETLKLSRKEKFLLSQRETDVLRGLSIGKNRAQIAHDLGVSENTIRVYIDSARHKLGAVNTAHAIAVAVSKGVLTI